jgi:glucose-6-phosphate isomerase
VHNHALTLFASRPKQINFGLEGHGLLMMTENSETILEEVRPGSVHYIPGNKAHRLINTGSKELSVSACWQTESSVIINKP